MSAGQNLSSIRAKSMICVGLTDAHIACWLRSTLAICHCLRAYCDEVKHERDTATGWLRQEAEFCGDVGTRPHGFGEFRGSGFIGALGAKGRLG